MGNTPSSSVESKIARFVEETKWRIDAHTPAFATNLQRAKEILSLSDVDVKTILRRLLEKKLHLVSDVTGIDINDIPLRVENPWCTQSLPNAMVDAVKDKTSPSLPIYDALSLIVACNPMAKMYIETRSVEESVSHLTTQAERYLADGSRNVSIDLLGEEVCVFTDLFKAYDFDDHLVLELLMSLGRNGTVTLIVDDIRSFCRKFREFTPQTFSRWDVEEKEMTFKNSRRSLNMRIVDVVDAELEKIDVLLCHGPLDGKWRPKFEKMSVKRVHTLGGPNGYNQKGGLDWFELFKNHKGFLDLSTDITRNVTTTLGPRKEPLLREALGLGYRAYVAKMFNTPVDLPVSLVLRILIANIESLSKNRERERS